MHSGSSAAFSTSPAEAVPLSETFSRLKKITTPLQDSAAAHKQETEGINNNNNNINNNNNNSRKFTRSSGLRNNNKGERDPEMQKTPPKEEQLHRPRVHPLCIFEDLYKIKKKLGFGSYSVVYEVMDRKTKEFKAAKFVFSKETRRSEVKEENNDMKRVKATFEGEKRNNNNNNNNNNVKTSTTTTTTTSAIPELSETIVKEIAISLSVQHPNLVSTSDVFVPQVEDLQRRLQPYSPELNVEFNVTSSSLATSTSITSVSHSSGSKGVKKDIKMNITSEKSYRPISCSTSDTAASSKRKIMHPAASASQSLKNNNTNLESNRSAVEKIKRELQEGLIQCILVMELLSDRDLYALVSRGPLDEAKAAMYMLDLLLALQYLHSKCIVHRDVKVENIVLDRKNKARLIDYGFCEKLQRISSSTTITDSCNTDDIKRDGGYKLLTQFCGSHHYVAPEVVRAAMQILQSSKRNEPNKINTNTYNSNNSNNNNNNKDENTGVRLPPISLVPGKLLNIAPISTPSPLYGVDNTTKRIYSPGSTSSLKTILASRKVGYGIAVDLWSAGVVLFVLLHASFPYHDNRRSKLLKMIMTGQQPIRFSPLLSNDVKDLLKQLLTHDVRRRPTASQALNHPWFKRVLGSIDNFLESP